MNSLLVDQRFEAAQEHALGSLAGAVTSMFRKLIAVCLGAIALLLGMVTLASIAGVGVFIAIGGSAFLALMWLANSAMKMWSVNE